MRVLKFAITTVFTIVTASATATALAEEWRWSGPRTITSVQINHNGVIRFFLSGDRMTDDISCSMNKVQFIETSQTYHLQAASMISAYANNTPVDVYYFDEIDSTGCPNMPVDSIRF